MNRFGAEDPRTEATQEPVTTEEKVAARIAELRKPHKRRGNQFHPELGRI